MGTEAADLRGGGRLKDIRAFIGGLDGCNLHAKRVDSLAAATLGVMTGASLAVAMIGQSLAQARGLVTKHAIKQVDRLLSDSGIDLWESFARWVPHLVGSRSNIVVAMDWTDFDGDDQATLALNLVTQHGRAMPLLWLSVWKDELKNQRNDIEDTCLRRLSEVLPPSCRVTILADRGFGDHKLFAYLADLGFAYVIRFRGNIHVTDASGETRTAANWVGRSGRAHKLRGARVTASHALPGSEDKDLARRLRKGTGADATASGATRIAGSLNFKEKYAPDFPRMTLHAAQPGRTVTADELDRLGLVAAPEVVAQPLRIPPARVSFAAQAQDVDLICRTNDASGNVPSRVSSQACRSTPRPSSRYTRADRLRPMMRRGYARSLALAVINGRARHKPTDREPTLFSLLEA